MEKKGNAIKMATAFIAGAIAMKIAEVCFVLAACLVIASWLIAFIAINVKRGETFSRKGIITLVVMILALILIGFLHLSTHLQDEFEAVEPPKTSEIVKTHDQKPEDTTTVQDIQDNSGDTGAYTPVISNPRGYCPEEEKMTTSFNNVVSNQLQGQTTTGIPNTIIASDNAQEEAKQDAEIEDAKEEGATIVEDTNTGIVAGSSTKPVEESKDETEKVEIDTDDAIDLETEGETTTPSEGNVKDESQNTLPEASEEVTTPVEGGMTFEEEVEETPVETVTPVGVTAIDGYESYINSDIQFQISGDDVVIEGLDGIEYTFNDGILTINTGSDATVLTVSVSNSVSATSFDVVINGIVG